MKKHGEVTLGRSTQEPAQALAKPLPPDVGAYFGPDILLIIY